MSDKDIKKLENSLKSKLGEDKLSRKLQSKEKEFDGNKFMKLSEEIRELNEEHGRNNSGTTSY